jgi:glycosyltransferase involved in cell wall biosynthesis
LFPSRYTIPVRIYYDHQLTSLQDAGGASRYHYELLRFLDGVPEVQTTTFLGFDSTVYPYLQLASSKTKVLGFRGPLRKGAKRYVVNEALANAVAPFYGKFDIYHPSHHRMLPFVSARRLVATHHDCIYERFPVFRFTKEVLRAKKKLFATADLIICISESSRADLFHYYDVNPAKTRVVHEGYTRLPRSPEAAGDLAGLVRRAYILYVSGRSLYKNFRGFLQAFRDTRLHESMDLLVLGGGPLTEDEREFIAKLGIGDAIVAIPLVDDGLLAEAYAGARLLAYPSLFEGFGLPPLEAMYLGCPVLACNTSSLPEICGEAPFYFEKDEPDSLRDALLRAVWDEHSRAAAIQCGREVAAGYSWEACGEQTLALYREVLE